MDIGTISLLLLLGLFFLLAIGMPLGLASAILAVFVLVMKKRKKRLKEQRHYRKTEEKIQKGNK